jgi:hypothetical protein
MVAFIKKIKRWLKISYTYQLDLTAGGGWELRTCSSHAVLATLHAGVESCKMMQVGEGSRLAIVLNFVPRCVQVNF